MKYCDSSVLAHRNFAKSLQSPYAQSIVPLWLKHRKYLIDILTQESSKIISIIINIVVGHSISPCLIKAFYQYIAIYTDNYYADL